MAAGPVFPAFLRLEHQRDGSAKSSFLAEVDGMLGAAERKFSEFSSEARRQLDAAMSVKRNATGSLDLGVDEARAAAAAAQARAVAAREVAAATALAAREEGDYSRQTRLAVAATQALAIEEEKAARVALSHASAIEQVQERLNRQKSATDAVTSANSRGTTAQQSVINSSRASRVAFIQLGQQMQDVAVQAQMGTNAFIIFGQQVPQAAFALSGLATSANRAQAMVGRFATFLAGPWGAAVFIAVAALGPLVAKLFEADEAARKAEFSTYAFKDAQGILASVMDLTTGKINTQSEALLALARAQAIAGQIAARREQSEARGAFGDIRRYSAKFSGGLGGGIGLSRTRSEAADIIEAFQDGSLSLKEAERGLQSLLKTGRVTEEQYLDAAEAVTKFGLAGENLKVFEKLDAALGGDRKAISGFLEPKKGKSGRSGQDKAARDAQRLEDFGDRAAESIARINERFDEQPRLIDAAEQATRKLDDIIEDLSKRKPAGFEQLIADAEKAKGVVENALTRPFRDFVEEQERSYKINELILAGREEEARALQQIYRLQDTIGDVTEDQRQIILDNIALEKRQNDLLEARQEIVSAYIDTVRGVRGDLEALLGGQTSGKDFLKSIKNQFQQLQGRLLTEQIFGAPLRALEDQIRKSTGIKSSVDIMKEGTETAGNSAKDLGTSFDTLRGKVDSLAGAIGAASASSAGGSSAFNSAFAGMVPQSANDNGSGGSSYYDEATGEIVVNAGSKGIVAGEGDFREAMRGTAFSLRPDEFMNLLMRGITNPLGTLLQDVIGGQLGAQIKAAFGELGGILGGAAGGYATGGIPGALIGGLKGVFGEGSAFGKALGKMGQGAQTGTMVAGFGKALGLKMSTTGSQIGGAIGSLIPIPGGEIIGAIAGGLLGGLFKKTKKGRAQIIGGEVIVSGNSSSREEAASGAADSILDSIDRIAEALGGTLDMSKGRVTIGIRKKSYRVDPTGNNNTRKDEGAIDFGDDQEAAIKYAIMDLIQDGVIQGLRESTQRLLKAGKDLDAQLQKAVDFEGVFKRLRAYKDPVGAAIDALNSEFERLKGIFAEAGASAEEYAQLEELYGIERAKAVKEAMDSISGSLRDLYDELTIGDSGLSLRDRRANAKAKYDPLAARVRAGDVTAFDDYAQAARDLLGIQREISGSQSDYFNLLNEVTSLSKSTLDKQNAIANASANRDSPFSGSTVPANDNTQVVSAIGGLGNVLLDGLGPKLDRIGGLLGAYLQQNPQAARQIFPTFQFQSAGNF